MEKSFIQKCIDNEISIDEIDNYIEKWHKQNIVDNNILSLREYLGLTENEYNLFVKNDDKWKNRYYDQKRVP